MPLSRHRIIPALFCLVLATAILVPAAGQTHVSNPLTKPQITTPKFSRRSREHPLNPREKTRLRQTSLPQLGATKNHDYRGGSTATTTSSLLSNFQKKEIAGVLYFVTLDILLRKLFNEKGITFPSMMAGCVAMFSIMVLAEVLRAGSGEAVFEFLSPGAGLLARWMSVFFVPGVAMLPTAPKLGSNLEAVKVLSIIVVGFFFSLLTTGFSVLGLRTMLGQVVTPSDVSTIKTKEDAATSAAAPAKPYSEEVLRYLVSGALVLFPVSIIAKKIEHPLYTPIQTLFMLCTSVGAYVYGARLPRSVTKIIHPLIVATTAILSSTYLTGCFTGRSFIDVLRTYKAGSLSSDKGGAGDFLLFMLGPAVCSLSIAMYSRKTLMKENFLVVLVAVLVSAVGGLFGTAGYVRLINLNGSVVRRSVLSRNVTTALAMAITKILEGNTSIAACVVVIVGIIGATYAARIMTFVGIHDPVARGLAMGSAAQGLGAASMISEKDAFPFAAINMILTAVAASTLASIPTIRTVLLDFALGKLKGETV